MCGFDRDFQWYIHLISGEVLSIVTNADPRLIRGFSNTGDSGTPLPIINYDQTLPSESYKWKEIGANVTATIKAKYDLDLVEYIGCSSLKAVRIDLPSKKKGRFENSADEFLWLT